MTALHDFIASENDIEGLRDLLRGGENPNSQDRSGRTPLHIAILKSERNPQESDDLLLVVRELIHYGANVDLGNNLGKTPLHFAVGCRNYKMIETLLLSNAQIDQKDSDGYAALHFATTRRRFRRHYVHDLDVGVVKLLLKYGPQLDIRGRNNETAVMLAVQNDNLEIVRVLLKNKASGNLQDFYGDSAMHYALRRPEVNVNIVLELMSHGCSFNATNHSGSSAMTLYLWGLMNAPRTEVEKAKSVFKLYVFDGNDISRIHQNYMLEISNQKKCNLSGFMVFCKRELKQMQADVLESNYSVYDIALRGGYYSVAEKNNHIPLIIFDKVLNKLIRGQYPVYCDLIVAGICSPYMNKKFTELCYSVEIDNRFLNFDVLYSLSFYLSHLDMLNMMIACSGGWRRFWYLPRFTYNTRCSVS